MWLWARRLPVRPAHPTTRRESDDPRPPARRRSTAGRAWTSAPSGPRAAVSAAVARRMFAAAVRRLPVTVRRGAPHGAAVLGQGGPEMTVQPARRVLRAARSRRPDRLRRGLPDRASDADDLAGFLTVLAADVADPGPASAAEGRALGRWPGRRACTATRPASTRNNIAQHYDLSNDLFATFLDRTLSYSSALFDTPIREHPTQQRGHLVAIPPGASRRPSRSRRPSSARSTGSSTEAQVESQGTRVLEIGTGWGELAIRAASRGAGRSHSVPSRPSSTCSPVAGRRGGCGGPGRGRAAATTAPSRSPGRRTTPCSPSR